MSSEDYPKDGIDGKTGAIVRSAAGQDLVQQALHNLSAEKKKELMDKAAEEVLDLQLDAHKRDIKSGAAFRDIHDHIAAVNKLDTKRQLSSHRVSSECETGSGRMRIESKKGPECFVATVVFEDEEAVEVQLLRRYRDEVLVRYTIGRQFVRWYYANGPTLAVRVKKLPRVKRLLRPIFSFAALLISPVLKRRL